jgi:hypothetical protein
MDLILDGVSLWVYLPLEWTCIWIGLRLDLTYLEVVLTIFFNFAPSHFDTVQATTPPPSPFSA